ncbi:hypothetical protein CJ030_MR7G011452 [Morella rubra]|uniref:Uncharacterized protein n=1 Tax=Morella rubra TaxID=262757 RepID=A0A6A1V3D1_9ROSI|nr:hypothetical protein CJ030_MR7G011452 [Morella rubra]
MGSSKSTQKNNDSTRPEDDASNKSKVADAIAVTVAVGVGVGLAAACVTIADLLSDSGTTKMGKTMKAPGRNTRINRDDFERDAAGYFRELRKK